ncbi:hypothetical protein, partial [Kandleria vitulina]|uniref:hypothetical protein n=1 Tax=Kandleria vitulina TaxID=1630 RepID=UPI001F326B72
MTLQVAVLLGYLFILFIDARILDISIFNVILFAEAVVVIASVSGIADSDGRILSIAVLVLLK